MRMHPVSFFLGALVASICTAASGRAAADATVLHAAHVFDGDKLLDERYVLVEGGRIKKISRAKLVAAHIIELGNETLLAGLADVHTHILLPDGATSPAEARATMLAESSAAKALRGLEAAQRLLRAGFTTLRDPGDFDVARAHLDVRDAIASGAFVGPHIYAADRFITRTGGHFDDNWIASDQSVQPFARVADGPVELVKAVREEVKVGADWIKIAASGGMFTPNSLPDVSTFTAEELRAIVTEAHRLHRKVAAHAHGLEALRASIGAGVDSVEHGSELTSELIRDMGQRGIYWVPTWTFSDDPTGHDPWIERWRKEEGPECTRQMKAALAAGVPIALGSDSGVTRHGLGIRMLALFVATGMSPTDALRAATVIPARMLDDREGGRVAEGFRADLIAVPGDPTRDIGVLERVSFVMIGGLTVRDEVR